MMEAKVHPDLVISHDLLEALRSFPRKKIVEHCGTQFTAAPFDFYASCPQCGTRIKLRSFSGVPEIEDVFDAVFEWMNQPEARAMASRRQAVIADDE
jgi:hypothetical protein